MAISDSIDELHERLLSHKQTVSDRERSAIDEATTTNYLVKPFVEGVLGFQFDAPDDVWPQFDVKAPGKSEKVDLALMDGGDAVVLVEVKKRDATLEKRHVEQLKNYFAWVTTSKFAALTNGVEWQWFKGNADPDFSHLMEDTPFLVHNALSPSHQELDWICHASKGRFDIDQLKSLSRQIEFTAKLRDWILGTLVSPDAKGARQLNELVELGASSHETPLVVDAIRSAWDRVLAAQHGRISESAQHSTMPHAPGQNPERPEQMTELPPSQLRFDAETHTDDLLDIGNGQVLNAKKFKRAWRAGGGKWKTAPSATALTTALLELLLKHDARRDDESILAELHELIVYSDSKPKGWVQRLSGFKNLYYHKGIPNNAKIDLLKTVAGKLHFDPPEDSPLGSTPTLEVWLVNVPKNAR